MNLKKYVDEITNKITSPIFLILLRLYYKFLKPGILKPKLLKPKFLIPYSKYISNIQIELISCLYLRIIEITPEGKLPGYDKNLDRVAYITAKKILEPAIFTDQIESLLLDGDGDEIKKINNELRESYYSLNKEEIDALFDKAICDEKVIIIRKDYWLICHYYEAFSNNKESTVSKYFMDLAKSSYPDATPLVYKDIGKIKARTKKEYKKIWNAISDRDALKISTSIQTIASILVCLSPLLFITGYLYNRALLIFFDINSADFFSLTDYVSASIEKLDIIILAATISIVIGFIILHARSRKSNYQLEWERNKTDYLSPFVICAFIAMVIWSYIYESYLMAINWGGLIFVFMIWRMSSYIAARYFKPPFFPKFFSVSFILLILAQLFHSVTKEIYDVNNLSIEDLKKYKFKFAESISYPEADMVLLVSSSNFFIFRNVKSKVSIVVPRDQILSVATIGNTGKETGNPEADNN